MSYLNRIKEKIALIRSGGDKPEDIRHLCQDIFWGQLELEEYPLQDKIEQIVDARDDQRIVLMNEFDSDFLKVLETRSQNNDVDAIVLLGQYHYGRQKDELFEDLLISETVDQMLGLLVNEDEVARQRIKSVHKEASGFFMRAYGLNSVFSMYYLAKLWSEGVQDKIKPTQLLKEFKGLWLAGDVTEARCGVDTKSIIMIQQALTTSSLSEPIISNTRANSIKHAKLEVEARRAMNESKKAKDEIEELMAFIAHSTRRDITYLEANMNANNDKHVYKAIVENLSGEMELFALLSRDSKTITTQLIEDKAIGISLSAVINQVIKTCVLLMLSPAPRYRLWMAHRYYQLAVEENIIANEIDRDDWAITSGLTDMQKRLFMSYLHEMEDSSSYLNWISSNFGEVQVKIDDEVDIKFAPQGIRYSFISAILSEFVINALKYGKATSDQPLMTICVTANKDQFIISCENIYSEEEMEYAKGSERGISAINMLLNKCSLLPVEVVKTGVEYRISCAIDKGLVGG